SGNFLHLVVSFSQGRNGELRHSVDAVNLLREVAGNSIEALQLYVSIVDITDSYITRLKELMEAHKGQQNIRMTVFDKADKEIQIGLRSTNGGIRIDNELLDVLEQNDYQFSVLTTSAK